MPTVGMHIDSAELVDAIVAGNKNHIIVAAQELLERGAPAAELVGRIGIIAARADQDGHTILTLSATSAVSRWISALPRVLAKEPHEYKRELPLLVQAFVAASPCIRAAYALQPHFPEPVYPSQMPHGKVVDDVMHDAIYGNDATLVERLLFGLYHTGADYRAMQVCAYSSIASTFQKDGHPLSYAVRGFQLLDMVEWGDRVPHILHWLAPHLPLQSEEPHWIQSVRTFIADPKHSLASLRVRLAFPTDRHALPLHQLILSDMDTSQVCQGVYDVLMHKGASPRGVSAVIALAAADAMQMVSDSKREHFLHAAHSLLFSTAARLTFTQVQETAILPLLFTSAAFINTLYKDMKEQTEVRKSVSPQTLPQGGGLIPTALLETLQAQLKAQDLTEAFITARRYLLLGHDMRALFATIALVVAQGDAADQGHTLQIVHAAGEAYMAWPSSLTEANIDGLLHVALRAAVLP